VARGIRPFRGDWSIRQFHTASAATFLKDALVSMDSTGHLTQYRTAATNCRIVGIANHKSVDSLPFDYVSVAVPGFGATALISVPTGVSATSLYPGMSYDIEASDATGCVQIDINTQASDGSQVVVIMGTVDSATSLIEVCFVDYALNFPPVKGAGVALA